MGREDVAGGRILRDSSTPALTRPEARPLLEPQWPASVIEPAHEDKHHYAGRGEVVPKAAVNQSQPLAPAIAEREIVVDYPVVRCGLCIDGWGAGWEGRAGKVQSYCATCEEALCKMCERMHRCVKLFANHTWRRS